MRDVRVTCDGWFHAFPQLIEHEVAVGLDDLGYDGDHRGLIHQPLGGLAELIGNLTRPA